jgi:hypothetical protein
MTLHEQRLLEIETARVRHAWAKAQAERAGATSALTRYSLESLKELDMLKANDLEMGLAEARLGNSKIAAAKNRQKDSN